MKNQTNGEKEGLYYTYSKIPLKPFYCGEDISEIHSTVGKPGEYPFTRGLYKTGYRKFSWNQRQLTGFGLAGDTRARQEFLFKSGQKGYGDDAALTVLFDSPTQYGHDSDDPIAKGAVGGCGVAVDTLKDVEDLFQGMPLDQVSIGMIIEGPATVLLAMLIAAAENQGISRDKLRGGITNNSLLNSYCCKNSVFPSSKLLRVVVDLIEFCSKEMPQWNSIQFSGYNFSEIGAIPAQEIAFTLATASAVVESCLERGLKVEAFASRFMFLMKMTLNIFEEIAKFRAGRKMWAQIMKNKFGATDKRSLFFRILSYTAGSDLTAQEPLNNIARVSLMGLASVLAGVQSLYLTPYDEALGLPTKTSQRVSLKIHKILEHEMNLTHVADPLGGSYYLEYLTSEIEKQAQKYLVEIEELGGLIPAIESGYMEREATKRMLQIQKDIDSGKKIVVGMNKFVEEGAPDLIHAHTHYSEKERVAVEKLKAIKNTRDNLKVNFCLQNVRKAAECADNLMYPIIEAVKAYATIGEIMGVLREVFGELKDIPILADSA